jgi:hypothetical protein
MGTGATLSCGTEAITQTAEKREERRTAEMLGRSVYLFKEIILTF